MVIGIILLICGIHPGKKASFYVIFLVLATPDTKALFDSGKQPAKIIHQMQSYFTLRSTRSCSIFSISSQSINPLLSSLSRDFFKTSPDSLRVFMMPLM